MSTSMSTDAAPARTGLELDAVTVRFGGLTALEDVSLRLPPGQVLGVMGPNGAGKTTLFNVVCGFTRPTSGSLRQDGRAMHPKPHHLTRLGIARTLQGLGLFSRLTVLENVMAGASHSLRTGFLSRALALPGSDREEAALRARASALLDELGILDVHAAWPDTLPYAVRKRVALARALISEPRILLLDEPAGGLSHDDIDELGTLIRSLPARGCSVMLVEHHVDLVMAVCEQIVVLDFGRVIATGTPQEVRDDPAVVQAYLGTEVSSDTVLDDVGAGARRDEA